VGSKRDEAVGPLLRGRRNRGLTRVTIDSIQIEVRGSIDEYLADQIGAASR
jgi:hypothetical protein